MLGGTRPRCTEYLGDGYERVRWDEEAAEDIAECTLQQFLAAMAEQYSDWVEFEDWVINKGFENGIYSG